MARLVYFIPEQTRCVSGLNFIDTRRPGGRGIEEKRTQKAGKKEGNKEFGGGGGTEGRTGRAVSEGALAVIINFLVQSRQLPSFSFSC